MNQKVIRILCLVMTILMVLGLVTGALAILIAG